MINLSKKLIGNEDILTKLISNYESNTLSNSILLYGSKGIGKSTTAFNFISKSFKKNSINSDYDHHVNLIYNNSHQNIRYVTKIYDEKKNSTKSSISIDQIRQLENFIYQSSINNLSKFIIIDSADDLNNNSANSLLKILEEPKKNTFFILISHQIANILPTIRSRCIKFNFKNPNFDIFSEIMKDQSSEINKADLMFLYNLSNASPGLALKINSEKILFLYNMIINILNDRKPLSSNTYDLAKIVSTYSNDDFKIFIIMLKYILMTITKINIGLNIGNYVSADLINYVKNSNSSINNFITFEILEYLNANENDLYIYNLDKKIFCLNIFKSLAN